jgi:hypothetical protein
LHNPEVSCSVTRATGVQAERRHPGEVAGRRRSWWITTTPKSYAISRPAPRQPWTPVPRRGAHPHPPAGGRGDGPRAAGAGTGRRKSFRRTSATGVPAARRRPGEVAARRTLVDAARLANGAPLTCRPRADHGRGRPPRRAHPIRAPGGRGDGPRAGESGRRDARYATQLGQPEAVGRRNCANGRGGTWLRLRIPVNDAPSADRHRADRGCRSSRPARIRRPTPCIVRHLPVAHIPSARRRSRRRTTGGAKRVMPPNPGTESIARRTCATGVQAARRHPVKWTRAGFPGRWCLPQARIPIRAPAVAATDLRTSC